MVPVIVDPVAHTLSSVLDGLRGRGRRERAVGELLGNVAWWLDTQLGTSIDASAWALAGNEMTLEIARLAEAPYLAAVGYLVDLGVLAVVPAMSEAATRIARRASHTLERTGFADDPVVLGGLWLLHRRIGADARMLRDEAVRVVASAEVTPAVAVLLSSIDPTLAESCRPFVVRDALDLSIAVAAANNGGRSRLFPTVDVDDGRAKLMAAACSGGLAPTVELDRAFAAIALARAIEFSTARPLHTRENVGDDGPMDLAVIVALKEEFRHLHPWLTNATPIELGGHQYYRARVGTGVGYSLVTAFVGDMGPVPAAVASSRLIERWRPRCIVLLGVAGSVTKEVTLGDVVVASQVDSYLDAGKAIDDEDAFALLPSGAVFRGARQLVSRVRNLEFAQRDMFAEWQQLCRTRYEQDRVLSGIEPLTRSVQVHDGAIASGPIVGASDAFRAWLLGRDRAYKAIEMEGGGVLWAAEQAWDPPRTLVVRGISDNADPQKSRLDATGRGAIRSWAMHNAIAFVWSLLDARLLPD